MERCDVSRVYNANTQVLLSNIRNYYWVSRKSYLSVGYILKNMTLFTLRFFFLTQLHFEYIDCTLRSIDWIGSFDVLVNECLSLKLTTTVHLRLWQLEQNQLSQIVHSQYSAICDNWFKILTCKRINEHLLKSFSWKKCLNYARKQ